jgi:predicted DNA-binding ribbon-helix-helix protein
MSASYASYHQSPGSKKKKTSTLKSKNVVIGKRRTSVRLDPLMWDSLNEICERQGTTLHVVCTAIAQHKSLKMSLSNAIRVFIVAYYRAAATEDGHAKSGHGFLKPDYGPVEAGQEVAAKATDSLQKIVQMAIG